MKEASKNPSELGAKMLWLEERDREVDLRKGGY
jgi:hypothetical protein